MNVLFITIGDQNKASTRFRVYNLIPHLEKMGVDCTTIEAPTGSFVPKIPFALEVLNKAIHHDVVYIQKVLLPPWFIKLLNNFVNVTIFDFDDAIYTSPFEDTNGDSQKLKFILMHVTSVIAGSPHLESYAKSYAENVYCLPTSIPKEEHKKWKNHSSNSGSILGWIGSPENLKYIDTISEQLEIILNSYPETELIIITSGDKPVDPLRDRSDVVYRQWSRDRELKLLSTVDIGIRPLIDDEWTRGKGGFTSVVQCMALQIPVVVSPVGMLKSMIKHGETGFFATSSKEWTKYISRLIEDTNLRDQIGERAYNSLSEQRFWTEQRAIDLYEVLKAEYN